MSEGLKRENGRAFQQDFTEKREKTFIEEGFNWCNEIVSEIPGDASEQVETQMNAYQQLAYDQTLTEPEWEHVQALAQARIAAFQQAIAHIACFFVFISTPLAYHIQTQHE